MGDLVALLNELLDLRLEDGFGPKLSDTKTFSPEDGNSLRYLIEPEAVDRGQVKRETRRE